MILIAHRGNIVGRNPDKENNPDYIAKAIKQGYDVEVDIWYLEGKLFLGHDNPDYLVDINWLANRSNKLWIHCKNMDALSYFNEYEWKKSSQFNYFSHDEDLGVLTSHSYIWSTNLYDRGILVLPEVFNKNPFKGTLGICSDVISNYKTNKAYTNE
ncbi:MAG: hypothetical protein L7S72_04605 [Flavobacteriales bacterium]|nr:hypothetical protein [Flavobacteriales bacterium]